MIEDDRATRIIAEESRGPIRLPELGDGSVTDRLRESLSEVVKRVAERDRATCSPKPSREIRKR